LAAAGELAWEVLKIEDSTTTRRDILDARYFSGTAARRGTLAALGGLPADWSLSGLGPDSSGSGASSQYAGERQDERRDDVWTKKFPVEST
jgi:hypothetical protein